MFKCVLEFEIKNNFYYYWKNAKEIEKNKNDIVREKDLRFAFKNAN